MWSPQTGVLSFLPALWIASLGNGVETFLTLKHSFQVLVPIPFVQSPVPVKCSRVAPAFSPTTWSCSPSSSPLPLAKGSLLLTLPLTSYVLLEEPPSTLELIPISDISHYSVSATVLVSSVSLYSTSYSKSRELAHQNILCHIFNTDPLSSSQQPAPPANVIMSLNGSPVLSSQLLPGKLYCQVDAVSGAHVLFI